MIVLKKQRILFIIVNNSYSKIYFKSLLKIQTPRRIEKNQNFMENNLAKKIHNLNFGI